MRAPQDPHKPSPHTSTINRSTTTSTHNAYGHIATSSIVDAIVLSDANSLFIEWALAAWRAADAADADGADAAAAALSGSGATPAAAVAAAAEIGAAAAGTASAAGRAAAAAAAPAPASTAPFLRVFTNPAEVASDGRLTLTPHDPGHGCPSCPLNMCKRATLARFLRERRAEGVVYDR